MARFDKIKNKLQPGLFYDKENLVSLTETFSTKRNDFYCFPSKKLNTFTLATVISNLEVNIASSQEAAPIQELIKKTKR